jgi:hypothetical protein
LGRRALDEDSTEEVQAAQEGGGVTYRILVAALFLIGISLGLWVIVDGLRTGAVRTKNVYSWTPPTKVVRTDQPFWYWMFIALYATIVSLLVWGLAVVVFARQIPK